MTTYTSKNLMPRTFAWLWKGALCERCSRRWAENAVDLLKLGHRDRLVLAVQLDKTRRGEIKVEAWVGGGEVAKGRLCIVEERQGRCHDGGDKGKEERGGLHRCAETQRWRWQNKRRGRGRRREQVPRSACFGQRDACQWPVRDRVSRRVDPNPARTFRRRGVLCAAAVDAGSVFASRLLSLLTVPGDVQGCSQCSRADNRTSHAALFSSSSSHAHSACSSLLAKRPPHRRSVLRSVPAV